MKLFKYDEDGRRLYKDFIAENGHEHRVWLIGVKKVDCLTWGGFVCTKCGAHIDAISDGMCRRHNG